MTRAYAAPSLNSNSGVTLMDYGTFRRSKQPSLGTSESLLTPTKDRFFIQTTDPAASTTLPGVWDLSRGKLRHRSWRRPREAAIAG